MSTEAASSRKDVRAPLWFAFTEGSRAAFGSIRAHRFRSFLTALGIIIGVAAVIAMVSIIQGLSALIDERFQGLGSNSVTVRPFTTLESALQGRSARLTEEDYELIRLRVDGIESITPIMGAQSRINYQALSTQAQVIGTTHSYQQVGQAFVTSGRFLSASDHETRRNIAVIGIEVRDDLSLPQDPVGEYIQINNEWVKIVGLLEEKGSFLGQGQDNQVFVPFSTMARINGNRWRPNIQVQLTVADVTELDTVVGTIRRILRNAHGLDDDEEDDFGFQTAEQLQDTIGSILDTVTIVMGGIVSISLLVGGIGIMNIMLVSVTERTREIGICKAIGAKRHHILLQFMLEALVLCLIGGTVGLAFGYGIAALATALIPGFPGAYTPLWAVALALGFSGAIGVIFGILPAAKAANLDPISSLRYE
ncbi:MAG TPA: ABC transporter permease [Gammaproteobacteria bacterium]